MSINEATIKGKWLEIKGEIQKAWGNLTADELEKTKGDLTSIAGLVHQKYGEAHDSFQKKFAEIVAPYLDKKEAMVTDIKQSLKPESKK
jgi:uncharacterized protein YjbJ (UPF0337 family)